MPVEGTFADNGLSLQRTTCVAEGAGRSLEGLRGLTRKARLSRRYSTTAPYRRPISAAERAAGAIQRD